MSWSDTSCDTGGIREDIPRRGAGGVHEAVVMIGRAVTTRGGCDDTSGALVVGVIGALGVLVVGNSSNECACVCAWVCVCV